jgi:hypothetical protein
MQGSQVLLKLMSEEGLESWTQKSVRCFLIAPDCAPVNDTLRAPCAQRSIGI